MSFFFFNDTATTEIYTLSLHDALPIYVLQLQRCPHPRHHPRTGTHGVTQGDTGARPSPARYGRRRVGDRKSTRLNSSHANISYAVFCLKKKKTKHASKQLLSDISQ